MDMTMAQPVRIKSQRETGMLEVTDESTARRPVFRCTVTDQTAWTMNVTFVDALENATTVSGSDAR